MAAAVRQVPRAASRVGFKPSKSTVEDGELSSSSSSSSAGNNQMGSGAEDEDSAAEEPWSSEQAKPAGHKVEKLKRGIVIREIYCFLELLHDSGQGRRVYLCECVDEYEPIFESMTSYGSHGSDDKRRRKCIVKVWLKGVRSAEETEAWLDMQVRLLRMKRHPNVVQPRRIREDEKAYYVEFDAILTGTSMLTFVLNDASTTEQSLRKIFRGILRGLHHLHSHGLSHRDVKPENIMLEFVNAESLMGKRATPPNGWNSSKNGIRWWNRHKENEFKTAWKRHQLEAYVRIIDLDTVSDEGSPTICGTPGYMAPEAYSYNPGPRGDLFGVGVIMYMLLAVDAPCHEAVYRVLKGERLEEVPPATRARIEEATIAAIEDIEWDQMPWEALATGRQLCQHLLAADPDKRAANALELVEKANWFQKAPPKTRTEDEALARAAARAATRQGERLATKKETVVSGAPRALGSRRKQRTSAALGAEADDEGDQERRGSLSSGSVDMELELARAKARKSTRKSTGGTMPKL